MRGLVLSALVGLGLLATSARAAGPYDGIWIVTYFGALAGCYSLHENEGTLVAISLPDGNATWDAYMGPRNVNTANLSTIVSIVDAQGTVTFTSDSAFILTVTSYDRNWCMRMS